MAATSVLLDDSDPRITYGQNWQVGFPQSNGPPGSFYNRTFHQLASSGSGGTFSFTFEGIGFKIGGYAFFQKPSVSSDTAKVFNCTVDSTSLAVGESQFNPSLPVCQADNLSDGTHTVKLSVASNSTLQPQLYLDYIMYTPLSESPLPSDTLFLPFNSPQIHYPTSGWTFPGGTEGASATSATLSVNYIGQSLTWFNCPNDNNPDATTSTVSYSIDNGTTLSSLSVLDNTVPVLFSVMLNSSGPHELEVSYSGTQNQNPLTFCGLGVSPGPINDLRGIALTNPSNGTNTTSGLSPAVSTTPTATSKKGHTPVIAGVVSAVVVLAVISVLGVVLFKRHRRQKEYVYESRFVDGRD